VAATRDDIADGRAPDHGAPEAPRGVPRDHRHLPPSGKAREQGERDTRAHAAAAILPQHEELADLGGVRAREVGVVAHQRESRGPAPHADDEVVAPAPPPESRCGGRQAASPLDGFADKPWRVPPPGTRLSRGIRSNAATLFSRDFGANRFQELNNYSGEMTSSKCDDLEADARRPQARPRTSIGAATTDRRGAGSNPRRSTWRQAPPAIQRRKS